MASGDMLRDEDAIPHSAKYTAATWHWAGLPCSALTMPEGADGLFSVVNGYMKLYRLINPKKNSLQHTLVHRHTMINRLLEQANCPQIIEIAAGFSPRGADISQRQNVRYYEVDLPDVVKLKKKQLEKTNEGREVLNRGNFIQIAGNVLELNFRQTFAEQKSFVITEGLMMYFTREEQMNIWGKIADFICERGGEYTFDYIPLDVEPNRSWFGNILHRLKARMGGDKQGYCYDTRTRWDVREDLLMAGFSQVEVLDSSEIAPSWQLPFHDITTRVIVYKCC